MRRIVTILTWLLLLPGSAMAQWSFDVPSIEAYIADHKDQRSLLIARSALEQANTLLHGYSRDANVTYKEINVELDKYTRAFDVIDVMYQTLRTSLNTYDTYETFKQRIEDYKVMLTAYWDKCLSHGDIVSTDLLIVTVNRDLLEKLSDEGEDIYRSFSDLVLYVTGAAACSASDLLLVLESINRSLDNIRKHLNKAYFDTWRYIQVRIGYWKAQVYQAKTIPEIVEDADIKMKRILLITLSVLFAVSNAGAQYVTYNHDETKMNQVLVMETGAGSLTPRLFYSVVHGRYYETAATYPAPLLQCRARSLLRDGRQYEQAALPLGGRCILGSPGEHLRADRHLSHKAG